MTKKLDALIDYLNSLQAPADLDTLRGLLSDLEVDRECLGHHVHFECDHYARNKVATSPWYELVCVCWQPGQRTPIHDHRASSCAFLVVEGAATEVLFETNEDGTLNFESEPFRREKGYICASWDADIHEIVNDTDEDMITLHIYSPALSQLHIYSRDTGVGELWTPHMSDCAGAAGL